jgi:hypothetical protein
MPTNPYIFFLIFWLTLFETRPLYGGLGILVQKKLVPAAKEAGVKLFVPAEYTLSWSKEDIVGVPLAENRQSIIEELTKADMPYLRIITGYFSDTFLLRPWAFYSPTNVITKNTHMHLYHRFFGIEALNNKINIPGTSLDSALAISSIAYIVAAMTTILTTAPLTSLANRSIGIYEVKVTTAELVDALKTKYGKEPEVSFTPVEQLESSFQAASEPLHRLFFRLRIKWANSTSDADVERWEGETPGYTKRVLVDLLPW